jgi:hypothetical protein
MSRNSEQAFLSNYKLLKAAIDLLDDDNLVWSADFECIRKHLSAMLTDQARVANHASVHALRLAKELTREATNA